MAIKIAEQMNKNVLLFGAVRIFHNPIAHDTQKSAQ